MPARWKSRRRWWIPASVLTILAACFIFVAGASGNLTGSTFEGNDGNLVVNTPGNTDWVNAPNRVIGNDLPTGTGDNSFGQGDKEDDPLVHVGLGSIPNNKADLAQFYVGSEQKAAGIFLYLGWTRANQNGTVNFDFEINQKQQPDLTTAGAKTLVRTTGDLLINYLFQGQGTPTVAIRTWTGSAWSAPQDASAFSEAAINSGGAVANPLPGAANPTPINQFGETAINLTAAGVFPPGVCEAFGSAFVKSRSSTSFSSEIKDFIAPVHINIANCATIVVKKVTVPSPDPTDTSFSFTSNFDGSFALKNGEMHTKAGLNPGNAYSVSETVPANWALTSFTCDDGSLPSAIDLGPGETVTCTATNTLQQGAIKVLKSSVKGQALAGAVFSIAGQSVTTGADGTACVDHLNFGSYDVQETAAPAGYSRDDTSVHSVAVNTNQTCADISAAQALAFSDTPLTDITATAHSEAPGGTSSSIHCVDASNAEQGNSPQSGENPAVAANGLKPGTYTCTIVVDP